MLEIAERVEEQPWFKKIEILRVINGWSQREAAEKCGVDQRVYWNWEKGMSVPVNRNKKRIAKAFNVKQNDIFPELYNEEKLN